MARKITLNATAAFYAGKEYHESNTSVDVDASGLVQMRLWGNTIAQYNKGDDRGVKFTLAGWNTNTTRERLRGLGINISTKRGKIYHDGREIDASGLYDSGLFA
jgi:hypothetical protein